jgi:MFS family permease
MEDALLASGVSRTVGVRRASAGNLLADEAVEEAGSSVAGAPPRCGRDSLAVLAVSVVCLGSLNFGTTLGYTSPAEPRIRDDLLGGDEQLGALMTSVVSLGALVGALTGGQLSAALSRRVAMGVSAIPGVIGWVLLALPRPSWGVGLSLTVLITARVLCGLAVGAQSAVVPVYISEVAPPKLRGFLGCCHQLAIALGVTVVYSLGQAIVVPAADCIVCGWRLVAVLCALPQVLLALIVMLPWFPESPRWLVSSGSTAKAVYTLARLRGVAPSDPVVLQELGEIQNTVVSWTHEMNPCLSETCDVERKASGYWWLYRISEWSVLNRVDAGSAARGGRRWMGSAICT